MFRSLKHRSYRIYLTGQLISLIGTWVQNLATSWLVYSLTKSVFWLGVTGLATQLPTFIFSLFTGVYVDHVKKHRLLIWTQSLALLQASILAVVSYTHWMNIYLIIFLNFMLGTINAFDMNARQSFVIFMVPDKKDIPNAIALNSMIANGTRLIGPILAGIAIQMFSVSFCFVINALSFVAVLVALLLIKVPEPLAKKFQFNQIVAQFKIGYHATFGHSSISALVLYLASTSFFGMPYLNLFPAMAHQQGLSGPSGLSLMTTMNGIGSMLAAFYLARQKGPPLFARTIGIGGMMLGLFTALCLMVKNPYWSLTCLVISGAGLMLQLSATNTMVQTLVEDDKRSRVLSFLLLSMMGISPFGSFFLGIFSEHFGLRSSLFVSGLICTFFAFNFLKKAPNIDRQIRGASFRF